MTFQLDCSVKQLNEMLDDREAQAGSSVVPGTSLGNAIKSLEDMFHVFFGNADSGVFDFENDLSICGKPANKYLSARMIVVDGVIDQVLDDRSQSSRFGVKYVLWQVPAHYDHLHVTVY